MDQKQIHRLLKDVEDFLQAVGDGFVSDVNDELMVRVKNAVKRTASDKSKK